MVAHKMDILQHAHRAIQALFSCYASYFPLKMFVVVFLKASEHGLNFKLSRELSAHSVSIQTDGC